MTEKNKSYIEAIEILSKVAFLLMNKESGVLSEEAGYSITEVSNILDVPINLVRKAFVELSSFNDKDAKGELSLFLVEDEEGNIDEELECIINSYKDKRERAFKSGQLDHVKFYVNIGGYCDIYAMLTAKDYGTLRKFLKGKYMSADILHMDTDDFYRVIPSYTDDSERDVHLERIFIDAIRNHQDMDITYEGRDKSSKTTIKPLKLFRYSMYGVSYVLTIENGEISAYRIDSITKAEVNEKSHIMIDDMKALERLPYIWGMDLKSGEGDVVLKVYNHIHGKVIDKVRRDLAYYVQHAGYTVEEMESGDIIVRGHVIGKSAFLNWVRTYGASMVILEPTEWGGTIIAGALRKLDNYK